MDFPVTVYNRSDSNQHKDLVSVGLPFPHGAVSSTGNLAIRAPDGSSVPAQFRVLGRWRDGSIRWALGRWIGDVSAESEKIYRVCVEGDGTAEGENILDVDSSGGARIDTGPVRLELGMDPARWIQRVEVHPKVPDGDWTVFDPSVDGGQLFAELESGALTASFDGPPEVLDNGPVACELLWRGRFAGEGQDDRLRFVLRLVASTGSGFVRVSLTLHNPRAQFREQNQNGHWRLGLPGAAMIVDAGLRLGLPADGYPQGHLAGEPGKPDWNGQLASDAKLVQDSSGGENWHHKTHVNRDWRITTRFRGYKMFVDGIETYGGDRSAGWGALGNQRVGMAVGVEKFWQNFPNTIRAERTDEGGGVLTCALFPHESRFAHELLGGEQKTHHLLVSIHRTDARVEGADHGVPAPGVVYPSLKQAMERRLSAGLTLPPAEQVIGAGVIQHTEPYDPKRFPEYEMAVAGNLDDPRFNLYDLREKWDEYGWRNFGDVIADCEVGGQVLSHYNLEYDLSRGMLVQALRRSGIEPESCHRWADLGIAAARHQADIDIYHTKEDPNSRVVYNGGKFTHTGHAVEPGRGGHRQSDSEEMWGDLDWPWGRGGSPESGHFDNVGMMLGYYLTGDAVLLDASMEVADLVVFKVTEDKFPQHRYNRTGGNNIMCCLEAWRRTWDEKYKDTIETILDKCRLSEVHGERPLDEEGLCSIGDWSATIFLKHTLRFIAEYERVTGERHEKGRQIVIEFADCYHKYGWSEKDGLFAYQVNADPSQTQYRVSAAAWFVLDSLAWIGLLREDEALRIRDLRRCYRMMLNYCHALNKGGEPTYHNTKATTYTVNNGHSVLVALARYGEELKTVERPSPETEIPTSY